MTRKKKTSKLALFVEIGLVIGGVLATLFAEKKIAKAKKMKKSSREKRR